MSSEQLPLRVLVVGSGIAGLTFAIAFCQLAAKRNPPYTLTIIDAASSFQTVGAGLALTANSLSILEQLGVYEDLLKVGKKAERVMLYSDSKAKIMEVPMREAAGYPIVGVERAKLHEILHRHLLKCSPPPEVLFSHRLVEITSDTPEGPLQAHFQGNDSFVEADIVVGADGVRSKVRDFMFPDGKQTPVHEGWFGSLGVTEPMKDSDAPDGATIGVFFNGKPGMAGAWSLPDGRQFWSFSDISPDSPQEVDQAAFRQTVVATYQGTWFPFFGNNFVNLVSITKPERMIRTPLLSHLCPTLASSCGRAALLGDAGHPMYPTLGQGGQMAIEDAVVLANALLPPPGSLSRGVSWFNAQRHPRLTKVYNTSVLYTKLQGGTTWYWRLVRSTSNALLSFALWFVGPLKEPKPNAKKPNPLNFIFEHRIKLGE